MKSIIYLFTLLLFSFSTFSETITITTAEYEPYVMISENKVTGVVIEIVEAAFSKSGINVVYENMPWKRGYIMTLSNKVDATIPYSKTPERELDCFYSEPLISSKSVFFYLKNRNISKTFEWETFEDFKKYKVGGTIGYYYEKSFKEAGVILDLVASDAQNVQKLFNKRIDTFLIDELVGWALIKKYYPNSIDDFSTLKKPESMAPMYLIIGKNNPNGENFMNKFNDGLKQIKESGEYDSILMKYLKM